MLAVVISDAWILRSVGVVVLAILGFFFRRIARAVDKIADNVQSIPGIRTDVQNLQTDVRSMNQRMEGSRADITTRLDDVQAQLDTRAALVEPVKLMAQLMEKRVAQGPSRRATDPPHEDHIEERGV